MKPDAGDSEALREQWDQLRKDAWSDAERAEIDALFGRYLP